MNIGIGGIPIAERSAAGILFRLLDLVFLHDLFALDHAAAAVFALIFALFAHSAAVGAVGIILDLRARDLLSA